MKKSSSSSPQQKFDRRKTNALTFDLPPNLLKQETLLYLDHVLMGNLTVEWPNSQVIRSNGCYKQNSEYYYMHGQGFFSSHFKLKEDHDFIFRNGQWILGSCPLYFPFE